MGARCGAVKKDRVFGWVRRGVNVVLSGWDKAGSPERHGHV